MGPLIPFDSESEHFLTGKVRYFFYLRTGYTQIIDSNSRDLIDGIVVFCKLLLEFHIQLKYVYNDRS